MERKREKVKASKKRLSERVKGEVKTRTGKFRNCFAGKTQRQNPKVSLFRVFLEEKHHLICTLI